MVSNRSNTSHNATLRVLVALIGILGVVTATALFFAYRITTESPRGSMVSDALLIFAGMTGATAILSFQGLAQGQSEEAIPSLRMPYAAFNEALVSENLVNAQEQLSKIASEPTDAEWREVPDQPWALSAVALLDTDPTLAMAKLRIDLEAELRRITIESGIAPKQSYGIMSFLRDLINNGVLPPIYEQPLKEISRAANEAVHGSDIFKFEAARVVMLGTQMLEQLHAYPAKNSHKKYDPDKS